MLLPETSVPPTRFGIIYLLSHRESGQLYVGQTVNTLAQRWKRHARRYDKKGQSVMRSAIAKYGEEAFDQEILDWADSQETLDHKERFWIAFLDTISPNGYNLKDGGRHGRSHPTSVAKQAASMRGKKWAVDDIRRSRPFVSPNKGKKMSPERIEQNRAIALARFASGWKHPLLGKKCSAEEVERNRQSHLGIPCLARRKPIQCFETGQVFSCLQDAMRWLVSTNKAPNCAVSGLSHVRDKANRCAYGYHWITPSNTTFSVVPPGTSKGTVYPNARKRVICVETGEIFDSLSEAAKYAYTKQGSPEKWGWDSATKISQSARTGCMRIGYHWRFVDPQPIQT